MGNKLGRKREAVDDKYTKPQGLYEHKDVDHKKLRKLILDSKLAPCYPGDDDTDSDLEECPICFLYYPSLNRSRCCAKGICTECFLQMKTPNSGRPTLCPFCKTSNYAVEYRGMKTKEEKSIEQIEEQRVIEANIRMRQQELQDEEERMQKQNYIRSSRRSIRSGEMECGSKTESSSAVEGEEIASSQHVCVAQSIRQPLLHRQNSQLDGKVGEDCYDHQIAENLYGPYSEVDLIREDEFDLDLEDVMVMEAIWLSIQGDDSHHYQISEDAAPLEQSISEYRSFSASLPPLAETATSSSSPSGGLACAIAALAERQEVTGDSSSNRNSLTHNMLPVYSNFSNTSKQVPSNYPNPSSIQVTPNRRDEWVAGVGASYAGSDAAEVSGMNSYTFAQHDGNGSSNSQTVPGGAVVPESFEEQMMLAMAVSLAETQPWNNSAEVAWP